MNPKFPPLSGEEKGSTMKLKQLEGLPRNLQQFTDPKLELEQYPRELVSISTRWQDGCRFWLWLWDVRCCSSSFGCRLDIDLIWCDIKNLGWRGQQVDTVVMNPPFGTRQKGSDMEILFTALKVVSQAVYSLHKTTTRDMYIDIAVDLWRYVLQMYLVQKKKPADIAVDLWRFVP